MNRNRNTCYNASDPRLELIGHCVDCREDSLIPTENGLNCKNCGRTYHFDDHGILRAFPSKQTFHLPAFYHTKDFMQWVKIWEDMIEDWVIYRNRFYRWFSMSGFRKIKGFMGKHLEPGTPVVDLGCGHGQLFSILNPEQCIGLDSNLKFLQVLKKRFPNALAIHGDFLSTPFKSGALKCTVSLHTLEHLYFLAESMEEVIRAMHPKGYFFFSIPTEGGLGWELGRRLVTGPHLKRKYNLSVKKVMDVEHINDAKRVLTFLNFYFDISKTVYAPFPFLRSKHFNSSISGIASHKLKS